MLRALSQLNYLYTQTNSNHTTNIFKKCKSTLTSYNKCIELVANQKHQPVLADRVRVRAMAAGVLGAWSVSWF